MNNDDLRKAVNFMEAGINYLNACMDLAGWLVEHHNELVVNTAIVKSPDYAWQLGAEQEILVNRVKEAMGD